MTDKITDKAWGKTNYNKLRKCPIGETVTLDSGLKILVEREWNLGTDWCRSSCAFKNCNDHGKSPLSCYDYARQDGKSVKFTKAGE